MTPSEKRCDRASAARPWATCARAGPGQPSRSATAKAKICRPTTRARRGSSVGAPSGVSFSKKPPSESVPTWDHSGKADVNSQS